MDTRTLPAAFRQVAEWYPDRPGFVQADGDPDRQYTYAEAYAAACQFANALSDSETERGDRVAFLSRTTVEHAVAYFGAQIAGRVPVTLHIREAAETIEAMLDRVRPSVVVFQPEFSDLIGSVRDGVDSVERCVCFDRHEPEEPPAFATPYSDFVAGRASTAPDVAVSPDDVAFVNFSSGTTGTPKGIVHTHAQSIEGAHLGQYKLRIRSGESYLIQATPSFIGWAMILFPTFNTGATGVFLERWSPESVLEATETYGLDLLLLVSTQWRRVLEADVDDYDVTSVSHAIYTGEPISEELLRSIRTTVCENVYTVYSSTEALNAGTVLFPEQVSAGTLESVGRPVPNTDIRLVDPDAADPDERVSRGDIGEILIRGPPVAERVWDPSPETAGLFHEDGWWFSGDLGRVDANGNLELKGRVDNMIVSGGINIYAEGVERELERNPTVGEALVTGVPDDTWGETVKAYVVPTVDDPDSDAIDEWCRENDAIANYQRPRHYEFVDELPRTSSGKLDRGAVGDSGP